MKIFITSLLATLKNSFLTFLIKKIRDSLWKLEILLEARIKTKKNQHTQKNRSRKTWWQKSKSVVKKEQWTVLNKEKNNKKLKK